MNKLILIGAAALAFLALACTTESGDGAPNVRVWIVDSAGVARSADTVYYSYAADIAHNKAAHGGASDSVMHGATCVNANCSEWAITDHVHGSMYIRAAFDSAFSSLCGYHGYAVKHVAADDLPMEVTITLDVDQICL